MSKYQWICQHINRRVLLDKLIGHPIEEADFVHNLFSIPCYLKHRVPVSLLCEQTVTFDNVYTPHPNYKS